MFQPHKLHIIEYKIKYKLNVFMLFAKQLFIYVLIIESKLTMAGWNTLCK